MMPEVDDNNDTPTYNELRVALENLVNEDCSEGAHGLCATMTEEIEAVKVLAKLGSCYVTEEVPGASIRARWITRGAP